MEGNYKEGKHRFTISLTFSNRNPKRDDERPEGASEVGGRSLSHSPLPGDQTPREVETNFMTTLGPSRRGTKRRSRDSARPKMVLDVDLNSPIPEMDLNALPANSQLGEGTSRTSNSSVNAQITHSVSSEQSSAANDLGSSRPTIGGPSSSLIDLDAIEDEVQLLSSSSGFPRARNPSTRNQPVRVIIDVDQVMNSRSGTTESRRERNSGNREYINCDYLDLEDENKTKRKRVEISPPEVPEPPKEPTFICPVCLNTLVDPISTVCGHIFCKSCIESSIKAQKKCPSCRRKLTMNSFHRVYLPTSG